MPAQRRLFITHAGELANLMARAVGPGASVARFIRSYVERHGREALLGNSQQFREIEATISREALLVMAIEVLRHVPRAFASGARGVLRPDEAVFAEAFATEFLASLGRIAAGSRSDVDEEPSRFEHDLELYNRWTTRLSPVASAFAAAAAESPFPDRCAMLLDPSMMETARREAVDFEIQLVREGAKLFENLGRHALRRSRSSPHTAPRPVRRPFRGPVRRPVRPTKTASRPAVKRGAKRVVKELVKPVKKRLVKKLVKKPLARRKSSRARHKPPRRGKR